MNSVLTNSDSGFDESVLELIKGLFDWDVDNVDNPESSSAEPIRLEESPALEREVHVEQISIFPSSDSNTLSTLAYENIFHPESQMSPSLDSLFSTDSFGTINDLITKKRDREPEAEPNNSTLPPGELVYGPIRKKTKKEKNLNKERATSKPCTNCFEHTINSAYGGDLMHCDVCWGHVTMMPCFFEECYCNGQGFLWTSTKGDPWYLHQTQGDLKAKSVICLKRKNKFKKRDDKKKKEGEI